MKMNQNVVSFRHQQLKVEFASFWKCHIYIFWIFQFFLKYISMELPPFQVVSSWHSWWRSKPSPCHPGKAKLRDPRMRSCSHKTHLASSFLKQWCACKPCFCTENVEKEKFVGMTSSLSVFQRTFLRYSHPYVILGHDACYLRKLRCASFSKLSKSMESYLLLVEAGSKSSEFESGRQKKMGKKMCEYVYGFSKTQSRHTENTVWCI